MEVRLLGDALLRSRPSPLLSFLIPTLSSPPWTLSTTQCLSLAPLGRHAISKRCLVTKTLPLRAPTAAAAGKPEADDEPSSTRTNDTASTAPKYENDSQVGSMLDSFFKEKRLSAHGPHETSKSRSPVARQEARKSSADITAAAFREDFASRNTLQNRQGMLAARMDYLDAPSNFSQDMRNVNSEIQRRKFRQLPPAPVRLDAFIGRSMEVDPAKGVDLARGLKKLEIKCSLNSVRQDVTQQRYHERGGLKRKRLKRERWRKRFMLGFKSVVTKVKDMKKRGW
ncbi:hypothetical protein MMC06_005997 [Schaereria dolodes]|nr:hypothetical protein [Schaereria dolodes]